MRFFNFSMILMCVYPLMNITAIFFFTPVFKMYPITSLIGCAVGSIILSITISIRMSIDD